jgi:hypothetical protein
MASPTFRSQTNGVGSDVGFTATEPASAAQNDGLLMLVLVERTFTGFTPPSGWTAVPNCNALDVGTAFTAHAYSILRGAGAPAYDVSWTTSHYFEWSVYAFPGVLTTASFIDASSGGTSTSGTQVDPPAITTTTDDTLICALAWHWAGWGGGGASAPSGYTLRFGAASYDHALSTVAQGAAGSADPGLYGSAGGSDVMRGMTIALGSVAGGGGGGGAVAVDHTSTLSFPGLMRKPKRDDGWIRGRGGLWEPKRGVPLRRAA